MRILRSLRSLYAILSRTFHAYATDVSLLYHVYGARNALKLRIWRTHHEWIADKQRNNTARFTHDSRIVWRVYKSADL